MKMRLSIALLTVALGAVVWGQASATAPGTGPATAPAATKPASTSPFKTDKELAGYALGLNLGEKLKGIDIDMAAFIDGMKDGSSGAKPKMTDDEIDDTMMALQAKLQDQARAEAAAAGEKNKKDGEAFLAENGKKEGVKTTASGLQYKVIKTGAGKMPKATDTVSVKYRGTLIDGKEFDASQTEPVEFPVNRVIGGWTEALQLMHEGDKWQLFIPAALAYKDRGAGPDIGPNAVLIFEVELLKVK